MSCIFIANLFRDTNVNIFLYIQSNLKFVDSLKYEMNTYFGMEGVDHTLSLSLNGFFSDCYLFSYMAAMNSDLGGLGGRPTNPQANPFGGALNGTGSGLIRTGLEAYGGRILDSSSEFMQSNVSLFTCFLFRDQCNYPEIRNSKHHSVIVRLHNICPTLSTTFKSTASM